MKITSHVQHVFYYTLEKTGYCINLKKLEKLKKSITGSIFKKTEPGIILLTGNLLRLKGLFEKTLFEKTLIYRSI